ncbi:MAG: LLM class flavin-dependent oxidoreductase [Thermoproteota archaeon]|jgi:alkanesulfonate monooxygenase SsuD/methylene tetrahydromethanopterin reductase-like flavin-dependent oxidoreductase (luciferase family)|nr:LLM class flavin-dependent oxidoreductase [Thermoproteota archaeon]
MNSIKERIGVVAGGGHSMNAAAAITAIAAAEAAGVRQIWMNQEYLDTLTIFAAATTKTSIVRFGTAVVQTYPRHPLALAQQVLALNDIAPGRLRLGIGPSHRSVIEGIFGLPQRSPYCNSAFTLFTKPSISTGILLNCPPLFSSHL